MKTELEVMSYYMAAEKSANVINTIEAALEFFNEHKIKPDDQVKLAMNPVIQKLKEWTNGKEKG